MWVDGREVGRRGERERNGRKREREEGKEGDRVEDLYMYMEYIDPGGLIIIFPPLQSVFHYHVHWPSVVQNPWTVSGLATPSLSQRLKEQFSI